MSLTEECRKPNINLEIDSAIKSKELPDVQRTEVNGRKRTNSSLDEYEN